MPVLRRFVLALSAVGCASEPEGSGDRTPADLPTWTFAVFMNGDNDIEKMVLPDLNELERAATAWIDVARKSPRPESFVERIAGLSPAAALTYVNRLSDFLFVASRYANHVAGDGDVLWVPGQNR